MGASMFYLPEAFLVDVADIDDQHQELVDVANDMERILNDGHPEDFEPLFRRFNSLMRIHFSYEEALMRDADYPHYDWHVKHHEEVIARTHDLIARCRENGAITRELIVESFTNILSDVVHADLSFAEFTKGGKDLDAPGASPPGREDNPCHPGAGS